MTIDTEHGLYRATHEFADPAGPRTRRNRRARWITIAVAAVLAPIAVAVAVTREGGMNTVRLHVAGGSNDADTWSALPDATSRPRTRPLVVSTDAGVLMWGGSELTGDGYAVSDGAYLDAATRVWRRLPNAPLADGGGDAVGVWTGTEVVVLNSHGGTAKAAAFNPTTFTWRALPDPPLDVVDALRTRILDIDGSIVVFEGGATIDRTHACDSTKPPEAGESELRHPFGSACPSRVDGRQGRPRGVRDAGGNPVRSASSDHV
jgi:hypothetical protein